MEQINPFGVFQVFACLCIVFAQIEWTGNLSFVSIVGSTEVDWECVGPDGLSTTIEAPMDDKKCEQIKNCTKSLTAIKNSTEFNSIVSSFKLICDDANKPEIIQIIQAAALVISYFKF